MSVVGTITKQLEEKGLKYFPALGKDEDIISYLITGNAKGQIYKCVDSDKCLGIMKAGAPPLAKGLYATVMDLINEIRSAVIDGNRRASVEAQNLVANTSVPIHTLIVLQLRCPNGDGPIPMYFVAEYIAYELAIRRIEGIINYVYDHIEQLRAAQSSDSIIAQFQHKLDGVRRHLARKKQLVNQQYAQVVNLSEKIRKLEKENVGRV